MKQTVPCVQIYVIVYISITLHTRKYLSTELSAMKRTDIVGFVLQELVLVSGTATCNFFLDDKIVTTSNFKKLLFPVHCSVSPIDMCLRIHD